MTPEEQDKLESKILGDHRWRTQGRPRTDRTHIPPHAGSGRLLLQLPQRRRIKKPTKQNMTHQPNPKEIKFQTIGTRAVVSKKITDEQAAEILQNNPSITQVDTPTGYYPRPTP
jgi:hypothetical protein